MGIPAIVRGHTLRSINQLYFFWARDHSEAILELVHQKMS